MFQSSKMISKFIFIIFLKYVTNTQLPSYMNRQEPLILWMLANLETYGIRGNASTWIGSYVANRITQVKINNALLSNQIITETTAVIYSGTTPFLPIHKWHSWSIKWKKIYSVRSLILYWNHCGQLRGPYQQNSIGNQNDLDMMYY